MAGDRRAALPLAMTDKAGMTKKDFLDRLLPTCAAVA